MSPAHSKNITLHHYAFAARLCVSDFSEKFEVSGYQQEWKELGINQEIGLIAYALSKIEKEVSIHSVLLIRVNSLPIPTPYTLCMGHIARYRGLYITARGARTQEQLINSLHPEGAAKQECDQFPADMLCLDHNAVGPLEALSSTEMALADAFSVHFESRLREISARWLGRQTVSSSNSGSIATRL